MKNKIKYFCFYDIPSSDDLSRYFCAASNNKIDYIVRKLIGSNYAVEIISPTVLTSRSKLFLFNSGCSRELPNGATIRTFPSITSRFRVVRALGILLTKSCFLIYSILSLRTSETILVYHSLGFMKEISTISKIRRTKTILEVEEIYSDVINKPKLRVKELQYINRASSYIFPTILLSEVIGSKSKKSIIVHGSYDYKPSTLKTRNNRSSTIKLVYAGTLDPRKGCLDAVKAMEFLTNNYHLYVLGFGKTDEVTKLISEISRINKLSKGTASYEGLKLGNDFSAFLQSCDIGLSPQKPDSEFNATSFPSKILSYLAHGLRVVSIRIRSIDESNISDLVIFYNEQVPAEIAKVISTIDLNEPYEPISKIIDLDDEFQFELSSLLSE